MGGDHGSRSCVLAALAFLEKYPNVRLSLFGCKDEILPLVCSNSAVSRISVVDCGEPVVMTDNAAYALRHKQSSSMFLSLSHLRDGVAHACVSGGNTAALMAMSVHLLKTMDGVKRPAICKVVPTLKGKTYLLDMGGNIECSALLLAQFARLGSNLAKTPSNEAPLVALLNIGGEAAKGGGVLQDAAQLIGRDSHINYAGFIEGNQIFDGDVDVIVCDGFVGNVALKVGEGASKYLFTDLKRHLARGLLNRLLAPLVFWGLSKWFKLNNPALLNGAVLLGLRSVVIKSHGGSDQLGFFKAMESAVECVNSA